MIPLRRNPHPTQPPTTRLETGPTLPTWTLHTALTVTCLGAVCAAAAGTALTGETLALLLLVLLAALAHSAWKPTATPAIVALATTGLTCITVTPPDDMWRFPVIILCVHATTRLSWFTCASTIDGRIETTVLRHEVRTFVPLDLAGQAIYLLALAGTGLRTDGHLGGSAVLGVAAALALVVLAVVLLGPRIGRRRTTGR